MKAPIQLIASRRRENASPAESLIVRLAYLPHQEKEANRRVHPTPVRFIEPLASENAGARDRLNLDPPCRTGAGRLGFRYWADRYVPSMDAPGITYCT